MPKKVEKNWKQNKKKSKTTTGKRAERIKRGNFTRKWSSALAIKQVSDQLLHLIQAPVLPRVLVHIECERALEEALEPESNVKVGLTLALSPMHCSISL